MGIPEIVEYGHCLHCQSSKMLKIREIPLPCERIHSIGTINMPSTQKKLAYSESFLSKELQIRQLLYKAEIS